MPPPPSQDFDLERLGASEIGAFLLSIDFDAVDVGFSFVPNEGSAELREWVKVAKKAKQLARQVESAALDDAWLNDCLAELLTSGRCNAALRKIMSAAEHSKAESKPASPEAGTPQLEGDLERPEKIPARELITTIYDTSHPGADLRREISPCGTHVQLGASWVKTNGQLALMDVDPMLVRAGLPQTQLPELLPLGSSSLTPGPPDVSCLRSGGAAGAGAGSRTRAGRSLRQSGSRWAWAAWPRAPCRARRIARSLAACLWLTPRGDARGQWTWRRRPKRRCRSTTPPPSPRQRQRWRRRHAVFRRPLRTRGASGSARRQALPQPPGAWTRTPTPTASRNGRTASERTRRRGIELGLEPQAWGCGRGWASGPGGVDWGARSAVREES